MHTDYVAGFMFEKSLALVALVLKSKPAWQAGKFNAIGGKVEEGETTMEAMSREFVEETGLWHRDWNLFAELSGAARGGQPGDTFTCYFYRAFVPFMILKTVYTQEEEPIVVEAVLNLNARNSIPNLPWLIRMALDIDADTHADWMRIVERRIG